MYSLNKNSDRELLLAIADTIELLVEMGTTEAINLAEKFGTDYFELKKKIETHDYSPEDAIDARRDSRMKHDQN